MEKLTNEEWFKLFDKIYDDNLSSDEISDVEIIYLGNGKYILGYNYEVIECGFKTEFDAMNRLCELEELYYISKGEF